MHKLKTLFVSLLAFAFSMLGMPAFAAGPDLTSLTSQVDFSTVIVALLAVAAALAGVYIAWKGAKMVLAALRGG